MFSGLRTSESIAKQLEQQTRFMSLHIEQHHSQKFHGSTSSEIRFQLFLTALFAVLVLNGQIMDINNLYVCDDNGVLHFVDYPFICSLIASLCNPENMFLLDYSWFLVTRKYKFRFPYEQWNGDCFTNFLDGWKQIEYKQTLSTRYFSGTNICFDSERDFKIPSLCIDDTIVIQQYFGGFKLCALTLSNLIILKKWDVYNQRERFNKKWVQHISVREFIDAYEPDILCCNKYADMIDHFINERRHNYTLKILKQETTRYIDALCKLLGFYACSPLGNDIAKYVMSFVGVFKFEIDRLGV